MIIVKRPTKLIQILKDEGGFNYHLGVYYISPLPLVFFSYFFYKNYINFVGLGMDTVRLFVFKSNQSQLFGT